MKIKMYRHYHGVLSKDKHLQVGQTYDLPDNAADTLIERGYAVEVAPETKRPSQKAAK